MIIISSIKKTMPCDWIDKDHLKDLSLLYAALFNY